MNDIAFVFSIIAVFIGGWLMGRASAFNEVRKQEAEFQRVRDSLHVPPPPPLTEEEEELIRRAKEAETMAQGEDAILLAHWNKMEDEEKFLYQFSYIRFAKEAGREVLAIHSRKQAV